ncbi:YheT family hydrolase [Rhodohalobacter halophilus]|uniref:YheT family hydrolase n=1 Tax=Rhodohalobacter halophilus TaxID=1812810 RepID=UPI00083F7339|nr:alpha/beta fold hydrolase [Rhodohalobacter halophilus]
MQAEQKQSLVKSHVDGFKSAPWCINGHVHTILCSLFFQAPKVPAIRVKIETPDDDFLELDVSTSDDKNPVAILFHGLEGHSRRYYIKQLSEHLINRGFTVIGFNFRSCGDQMNRNKKFYHSGEVDDLETVFQWVENNFPNAGYYCAAGFSLGASALLNYLYKHGEHHLLDRTAAISTPFELRKGSLNLNLGFNKVYAGSFLKTLKSKLQIKKKSFPELPDFNGSTIYEFDDQITAPIHGFEGADHYYASCSSAFFMSHIRTKTLVLHSQDDPLCPFRWTPINDINKNSVFTTCYPDKGGHVGFWSIPPGWINKTIGDYFLRTSDEN